MVDLGVYLLKEDQVRMCIQALSDIVAEGEMDKGKGTIGLLLDVNDAGIDSYISLVLQLINKLVRIRLKKTTVSMYWFMM